MNTSKVAVVANAALGKIASIIGWTFGALMLALSISFAFDGDDTMIFTLVLLAGCIFLIIKGIKIKRRIKRFKKYVSLISAQNMTSLDDIAASTNQSVDFVRDDLQKMIKSKFFANASIDIKTDEIIIGGRAFSAAAFPPAQAAAQTEYEAFRCNGCGASGSKPKGAPGNCDYCGSLIQ